jgi:hypothetical protein
VSQPSDNPENGHSSDVSRPGEDELVRRLRHLSWPEANADLRDRCWEDFRRRLGDRHDEGESSGDAQGRDSERRLDFTRRERERVEGTSVTREREAIAQSASRRR